MVKKIWKVTSKIEDRAELLAQEIGVTPLVAQLLLNRGINDAKEAATFLRPDIKQLNDPFLLKDMERAVKRIERAINENEYVLLYGDYDVDGITSISLMVRVLARLFSGRLLYYIPKRLEEGYGLHRSSLEKVIAKGVTLVITVDCGISAFEAAEYLKAQGVDLIITDHHEPQDLLPDAFAIINPKLNDSVYPFSQLAGVGVAFKLLQGLAEILPEIKGVLFNNLDLVAFGTVADIVPLLGENRVLVKYGLQQINSTKNIGLQALIQTAGLKGREINSGHIGFILAPRINAAGRMGNPSIGVKLFINNNIGQALELARELDKENQNRQEIENAVLLEAQEQIKSQPELLNEHALVLASEGWHLGVIGIVASRLVELYNKPVILIGMEGDEGRGSGRSISGFNLFEAIEKNSHHLIRFGGHEFAAGLSISKDKLAEFKEGFLTLAKNTLRQEDLQPVLKIEGIIDLNHINMDMVQQLMQLAPCGPSNPTPILGCRSLNLVDIKSVGDNGKHLKVRVSNQKVTYEGIGFNLGSVYEEVACAREVDLAFSVEENNWNGISSVQLNLKDVRVAVESIKQVS
ncbi:MAG TPA: single-stranded-DNA-specific exonuclease RecJ [Bacillota bacterium]|nr:single-stranded-DNA-specific exonuclease RecJ [Bacillota bacterium]HOL09471.1 single-stranded-DNA-specific exonuclease RecJ [Bacillota bacterium]HPO97693.1 single-stranded-DNA-specific exonuclease RecJ [Bacillota bacterium]